jgi:hypothetical protein
MILLSTDIRKYGVAWAENEGRSGSDLKIFSGITAGEAKWSSGVARI